MGAQSTEDFGGEKFANLTLGTEGEKRSIKVEEIKVGVSSLE